MVRPKGRTLVPKVFAGTQWRWDEAWHWRTLLCHIPPSQPAQKWSRVCSLHSGMSEIRMPQETRSGRCKRTDKLSLLKWTVFSWMPESSEGSFGWAGCKCCVASCAGLLQHLQNPRKQRCGKDTAVSAKRISQTLTLPWNHCTGLSLWLPVWKTEVMKRYLIVLVKCLLIQGWKIWAKHKVPLILSYFLQHC